MTEQPNFPYYNVVDQIFHAEWSIPKLARQEMLRMSIRQLWPDGHPTKLIQVAGTGGKGSTCRFLELGFGCAGHSAAFMSPHLFDYRERFSIDGHFIEQADIIEAWETRVRPHCIAMAMENETHIHTYLQISILIALTLFEKYEVEWAAIEAFVGGRYDHTRALDVVATLLTNVGSDHAHLLGRNQWQRTLDKAGIARQGIPFFTTEADPETLDVVRSVCQNEGTTLHLVGAAAVQQLEERVTAVTQKSIPPESLLSASYQKRNATLAYTVIKHLCPQVDDADVFEKFIGARLLGRFWKVEERVYADIAHNPEKIGALADEIQDKFRDDGKILVVGASRHRVPLELFATLAKIARSIIITGSSFKGLDPHAIQEQIAPVTVGTPTLVISDPQQALQIAKSMQNSEDVIILTGSTYMIEQVLNPDEYLRYMNRSFGWRMEEDMQAKGTVELTLPTPLSPLR